MDEVEFRKAQGSLIEIGGVQVGSLPSWMQLHATMLGMSPAIDGHVGAAAG